MFFSPAFVSSVFFRRRFVSPFFFAGAYLAVFFAVFLPGNVAAAQGKPAALSSTGIGTWAKGPGARRRPGAMEPRRSTMGSPLSALLIDCAGPVLRVSTRGGRFWLAAGWGREGIGGGARGGLTGMHGDPSWC